MQSMRSTAFPSDLAHVINIMQGRPPIRSTRAPKGLPGAVPPAQLVPFARSACLHSSASDVAYRLCSKKGEVVAVLRWRLVLLGSAGVAVGCFGLLHPIDDHSRCGQPFSLQTDGTTNTEMFATQIAPQYGDRSNTYDADCRSAADARTAWGLPVVIGGGVLLVGAVTARGGGRNTPT
jgi:hypothetical protein